MKKQKKNPLSFLLFLIISFSFFFNALADEQGFKNKLNDLGFSVKESSIIRNATYYLLLDSMENQKLATEGINDSLCVSEELPRDERYATGEARLSFSDNNEKDLILIYDWNSGHTGGSSVVNVKNSDCEFLVTKFNRFNLSALKETITVNDKYDFLNNTFAVDYNQKSLITGAIVNANQISINNPERFSDFEVVYGEKNIKDNKDFSALLKLSWEPSAIKVNLTVKDDSVQFGKGIHSDHVEIWYASTIYRGKLLTKPKDENEKRPYAKQFMINIENNKIILSVGYPEESTPNIELKGNVILNDDGYNMQFEIPNTLIYKKKMFKKDTILNMTTIVSDADDRRKQESMIATSKVKWGNPSTFGRVLLKGNFKSPKLSGDFFL
ncbi:hypothetical protein KKA14_00230 [bacterium]|nr:hypothetical protein [bacterium]